ncbi:MAG: leucine-rich repeat domain-containing protein [Bacteroidales bacterium]|nr:leucine-rich repeat domain-containing protein [Bacteroidales bacterium]
MKRFCLLLLGYFLAITVFAKNNYDFHVGDVYYKILNDNEVEVTYKKFLKEDKKVTQIVVPETVTYKKKNYRVVAIGDWAFKYYYKLQSVTLPNSIKKIGESAFGWCGDLANINMPDSLVEIGDEAFRGPLIAGKHDILGNKIEQIVLPNTVKFIGKDAFNFCTQLKNLKLPDTLRNIEDRSFQGCWALTQIDIPSTVTSIGKEAFWGCSKLRRVNLPNSVLTIGSEAFSDCVQLDSVEIPHSVKSIGNNAFKGCKGLKYAYIDTDALKDQLNGLDSLRSVIFGPSVTKISAGALKDCKNLRIVYISPSVEKIGSDAIGNADSCTVLSFVRERPSSWNEKFTENENQVIWGAIYISDEGLVFNISPADKEAMELVGSL